MPGERRPRRWAAGGASGSSASPSSTRGISPAASPAAGNNTAPPQQQRWGSSLSTQRRERTVVWASCLQKVQALRQGGSWQRAESGTAPPAASAAALLAEGNNGSSSSTGGGEARGCVGAVAEDRQHAEDQLNEQLDILSMLIYPNSSIRYGTRAVAELLPVRSDRRADFACNRKWQTVAIDQHTFRLNDRNPGGPILPGNHAPADASFS